jgi:hypothetical protein
MLSSGIVAPRKPFHSIDNLLPAPAALTLVRSFQGAWPGRAYGKVAPDAVDPGRQRRIYFSRQ